MLSPIFQAFQGNLLVFILFYEVFYLNATATLQLGYIFIYFCIEISNKSKKQ